MGTTSDILTSDGDETGQIPVVIQFMPWMDRDRKERDRGRSSICLRLFKV